MRIDDYITNNGSINRSRIADDIKNRKLNRAEIEELVLDERVQAVFLNDTFSEKLPPEKWDKNYLEQLSCAAIAESFNRDYLLYLNAVASHVARIKWKKIAVGAVIILLVIVAGKVIKTYILYQRSFPAGVNTASVQVGIVPALAAFEDRVPEEDICACTAQVCTE